MSATTTAIEWTDATWNPVRGCSRVSEGCRHCYAERIAARFSGPGKAFDGLARRATDGEARWTGVVRALTGDTLTRPLRWRDPRRIFVNSMSDLFHENLPDEAIAAVFGVMAAAPQHTFQVLTKRSERMVAWFEWLRAKVDASRRVFPDDPDGWIARHLTTNRARHFGAPHSVQASGDEWPLPNVWLGVSVENQDTADERIPHLLATPAAVRFLSCEPLLEAITLRRIDAERSGVDGLYQVDTLTGRNTDMARPCRDAPARINWVIVGGESGPGARPMDIAWARAIVEQCRAAGVACFVKQLGAVPMMPEGAWRALDSQPLLSARNDRRVPAGFVPLALPDRKGGDMAAWPVDLRVREYPTPEAPGR